jgi:hypothetical protein
VKGKDVWNGKLDCGKWNKIMKKKDRTTVGFHDIGNTNGHVNYKTFLGKHTGKR